MDYCINNDPVKQVEEFFLIQDQTNQYIATILSQCDLHEKDVLEIGCGRGRITRDLAQHARKVVATDPDSEAIAQARAASTAHNVEFILTPDGIPDTTPASFDVVVYTLSLHHVPATDMSASLCAATRLLRNSGVIIVIEPGDGGSFTEAKERFGAGSGDERPARQAAIHAMHALEGWNVEETILFRTLSQFDDDEDFFSSMLNDYLQQPESFRNDVKAFLNLYRTSNGIILDAGRRLNVLRSSERREPS